MNSKPQFHLPLLLNPLLNSIFNNPNHNKPPLKQTIHELAHNHNDFTILVPPSSILNHCYDPSSTKSSLHDYCYHNEDFLRSHLIKTSSSYSSTIAPVSKVQLIVYNTMNGKQILIKNGMVFTGKGFKRSLRLKVLNVAYFNSFCDYFPKGSRFMVLFIEDTLFGSYKNVRIVHDTLDHQPDTHSTLKQEPSASDQNVTFEELLRSFPLLSRAVSDKFYRLFHHNNHQFRVLRTHTRKKLSAIKIEFQTMLDEAYKIILDSVKVDSSEGEQTYFLVNHILSIYPTLSLTQIVHEYVELNLYDQLWSQIVFQFNHPNDDHDKEATKILTADLYNKLSCLSLNQLDLPDLDPWQINILQKRICRAIEELTRLSDANVVDLNSKATILRDVIKILTETDERVVVDADTLIGLFIMVVVHSKVPNLEAHLYYLKNFNSVKRDDGYFNYILSNLEAVIFHLSQEEPNSKDLATFSQHNFNLWSAIKKGNNDLLLKILEDVENQCGNDLPKDHFLRSKNIHGESCLMFAINAKRYDIFKTLIDFNPSWFSMEDILFDKNTTTDQTLFVASLIEECRDISIDLANIVMDNASYEEQYAYFNLTDINQRSAGHYLYHDIDMIDHIGKLIDWKLKDLNGHTPLFSLCRCYDHLEYSELVKRAFSCVWSINSPRRFIDLDAHIDNNGNTLLHVVNKNLPSTGLLTRQDILINVNQLNNRQYTPMDLYVKYNRLENIKDIVKDDKLFFLFEDPTYFYNVFDHLSFQASKALSSNSIVEKMETVLHRQMFDRTFRSGEDECIAAINAKYDPNIKDWIICCVFRLAGKFSLPLNKIRQKLKVFQLRHPLAPFDFEKFWINFPLDKPVIQFISKYRINRFLEDLNMFFSMLDSYDATIKKDFMRDFSVGESLTFDTIQALNAKHEELKDSLGEVKLTTQLVTEIEFFLNYSLGDLQKFYHLIAKINKLIAVSKVKDSDLRFAVDSCLQLCMSNSRLHESTDLVETKKYDNAADVFLRFSQWLEMSVLGLIKEINFFKEKIAAWKSVYDKVKEYNAELKSFETNAGPTTFESANHSESPTLSPNVLPEEILNNEVDGNHGFSFFNFGNLMENRKTRYRRLLQLKSEEIKKIVKFNSEMKLEHEQIASEVSLFLTFRPKFISLGVKRFTSDTLVCLRDRRMQLCKQFSVLDSTSVHHREPSRKGNTTL